MYCYFKCISTQCHCYFLLYFQIYCNIALSCTFKSTYIIIKSCGSWSPYIGREVSSYLRSQTSKFRLYRWHFRHRNLDFRLAIFTINICAHRPKPSFSELFYSWRLHWRPCLTSAGGHQPNLLKGIPIISFTPNFGSNWAITRFYFISGTKLSSFSYDGDHFWWLKR